jgi:hypothetical protein
VTVSASDLDTYFAAFERDLRDVVAHFVTEQMSDKTFVTLE